jgi:hypothetical protein
MGFVMCKVDLEQVSSDYIGSIANHFTDGSTFKIIYHSGLV